MPNHYHFLISPLEDEFSKGMQRFSMSYVKSINLRYNRVGHLFQGNFKARLIDDNNVLLHLSRYIHLNPVHASLVKNSEDWEFSSYREYIGQREGTLPKPDFILNQFGNHEAYKEFVESYREEHFTIVKDYVLED
jgi:putative transposase